MNTEFDDFRAMLFKIGNEKITNAPVTASIMAIDDNPDVLKALQKLFEHEYKLTTCLSYSEAECLINPQVKVVLLDIKMAEANGLKVFKHLKQQHPDLKIIFHSAYPGNDQHSYEVERLPHDGYLVKGEYSTQDLLQTIEHALHPSME